MRIFENCLIQAPDGVNLSRCGIKKLRWYLNNNLGTLVSDNPPTIRLNFEPSGREGVNDPFLTTGKPNICVVCGTDQDLTKHHIIPYCFIRYMKLEYKMDIIRDIFPLCEPCHQEYEKLSYERKKQMAADLGITVNGLPTETLKQARKIRSCAGTLLKYGHEIPESRREEMMSLIKAHLGKTEINREDLAALCHQQLKDRPDYINFSKLVAQNVSDYDEFAKTWRTHFVETMKPKHMPELWQVDRKANHYWIPKRFLI